MIDRVGSDQSELTMDVNSTVSAAATVRARASQVFPSPVEHDDIPNIAGYAASSTVTKSTPRDDTVAESSASISTAPTSVSDVTELKQHGIKARIGGHMGKQAVQEDVMHGRSSLGSDSLDVVPTSLSDNSNVEALRCQPSTPQGPSASSSKVAFVSSVKDAPPTFPSPNVAAIQSQSSTPANRSISSLKRASTGSTQLSSNQADSGSDISSHASSGRWSNPVGDVPPALLLKKTSNGHLNTRVSPPEELNADVEMAGSTTNLDETNPVRSTAMPDVEAHGLKHRDGGPTNSSSDLDRAEKGTPNVGIAEQDRGSSKKLSTRRKLFCAGLALVAMATVVIRPKLPPQ
ncbi:MAG: hypothetical protein Q9165_007467 [Trypethelium subeluteriae]